MTHSPHTLCLSGWAQHHDALDILCAQETDVLHFSYAPLQNTERALDALAQHAPSTQRIIGWSLGGLLALHALSEQRIHTRQLVLIATPAQFVASEDFPHGMDTLTFSLFHDNYTQDAHRTSTRFHHLITKGDRHHQHITPQLAPHTFSAQQHLWQSWLHTLKEQRHHHHRFDDFPPTLIIHGEQDHVVSHAQAQWLARMIPHATLITLPDCGHAPHLHNCTAIQEAIARHAREHGI
jgi:pimeloyl-[acyl-carrier protein] methyl ester esterase